MGYSPIFFTDGYNIVSDYNKNKSKLVFNTEAELEEAFIKRLVSLGYERLNIKDDSTLLGNLRKCLSKINKYQYNDDEWKQIEDILTKIPTRAEKTKLIQHTRRITIKDVNGQPKNVVLLDDNIYNATLQVINQFEAEGNHKNRYDVTVLINGFPMVQIELKKSGVHIRSAFNQIERYKQDSFWVKSGLYEFVQLFVISNGTLTRYYSNTTREIVEKNTSKTAIKDAYKFTSQWADSKNNVIESLGEFTETFFAGRCLMNIITKYCVFDVNETLKVMRPYQIAGTEHIVSKLNICKLNNIISCPEACGYIWHTTGSGKTLTSFKAAQLISKLPHITKVLFVVDRKDLDYQTMREYNSFQKDSVDSTKNTKELAKKLSDKNCDIIVTTINKLSSFIKSNPTHEIYKQDVVLIFDECHRSQFGQMQTDIKNTFKRYHMFGFTGTPIMTRNANLRNPQAATTGDIFGDCLHQYTVVNAIVDKNVLPFKVSYVNVEPKLKDDVKDREVEAINIRTAEEAPERIDKVTNYIIDNYETYTKGVYNSMFATTSVGLAKLYYESFRNKRNRFGKKIATIFTYNPNEEREEVFKDGMLEEDNDVERMPKVSRDFLDVAIKDYNEMFKTNFSTDTFDNYYKDVANRMKKREIDILIVVNMFLTGFDAPTLNTLWVDKNLRMHGLMQAYSRTNRILNDNKDFGNVVCFKPLQKETEESISLFGDIDASSVVLLKSYEDYLEGYTDKNGKDVAGFRTLVKRLTSNYNSNERIVGEQRIRDFVQLFGKILKLENILSTFIEFKKDFADIIDIASYRDYRSRYFDAYDENQNSLKKNAVSIANDLEFNIELAVRSNYNVDTLTELISKYKDLNCKDKDVRDSLEREISSEYELRSKKELIENYIEYYKHLNDTEGCAVPFEVFVVKEKERKIDELVNNKEFRIKEVGKQDVKNAIERGFDDDSVDIAHILRKNMAVSRMDSTAAKQEKVNSMMDSISKIFREFANIIDNQ